MRPSSLFDIVSRYFSKYTAQHSTEFGCKLTYDSRVSEEITDISSSRDFSTLKTQIIKHDNSLLLCFFVDYDYGYE
jgi:hypothetical protein